MADEESKQESAREKSPAKQKTSAKKPGRKTRSRSAADEAQPVSGYQDPFAGGAAALFEYAEQLEASGEDGDEEQREAREPWVCFDIADRRYGLPVQVVQEVLRVQSITRVPHAPPGIRGVTNMRGRVLPVVDLRLRLGFPEREIALASRILVALAAAGPVGLLVDAVEQMLPIAASEHSEPPAEMRREEQSAALAVVDPGDQPLLLLDLERLLEPIAAASLARAGSVAAHPPEAGGDSPAADNAAGA